jgi:hypothetical protein
MIHLAAAFEHIFGVNVQPIVRLGRVILINELPDIPQRARATAILWDLRTSALRGSDPCRLS